MTLHSISPVRCFISLQSVLASFGSKQLLFITETDQKDVVVFSSLAVRYDRSIYYCQRMDFFHSIGSMFDPGSCYSGLLLLTGTERGEGRGILPFNGRTT